MKVLRVTSLGYENGGVETGILLLQKPLEDLGCEIKVLSSNLHPERAHFNDFEFDALENQPFFLRFFYRAFFPKPLTALKRVLKEYEPDVVHIHTMVGLSASVLFALKKYPTVVTVHQPEDYTASIILETFPSHFFTGSVRALKNLTPLGFLHYIYHRYVSSTLYAIGFKYVDAFVTLSRYMQSQLEKDGIHSTYVPNFAKLFRFTEIDEHKKNLLYVGRLEDFKGCEFLIQAMSKITHAVPDAKLSIAGTGQQEAYLKKLVHELQLEGRIEFLGHKGPGEIEELFRLSTLVVVPSLSEPFGKVGIEAMSAGRPVIGARTGGIPEWLADGETGYLVPPGDSDAIADKVIPLLQDAALCKRMAYAARTRAETFSIESHAKKMFELYNNVSETYK